MTKYILHGGNTGKRNTDNDGFFRELTDGLKNGSTILLNYFARPQDNWDELYKQDIKRIKGLSKVKNLKFVVADYKTFDKQLKKASAMYMRGGSTGDLMRALNKFKSVTRLFKGKTIAGSSAGAYALCKYYFENDDLVFGKGTGAINLKAYCHYKNTDQKIIQKLLGYKENLDLLILADYKYQIIFQK